VLGGVVLALGFWPGCTCGSDESVNESTGGTGGSTSSQTGGGGQGGEGAQGGQGGEAGQAGQGGEGGGGGQAPGGVSSTESVSAGTVVHSPSYTLIFTFGQPTQSQGKTTSPNYRMQGGLVGANGSLQ
jgi:hypothetical protein